MNNGGAAAVGQFKELVEIAERDQPLQQSLIKALNLTGKVRTCSVTLHLVCVLPPSRQGWEGHLHL